MNGRQSVELNDEVIATGHRGRFIVVGLQDQMAEIQLFGDDVRTGERVYFEQTEEVPVSALSVVGKDHQKSATYRWIPRAF